MDKLLKNERVELWVFLSENRERIFSLFVLRSMIFLIRKE